MFRGIRLLFKLIRKVFKFTKVFAVCLLLSILLISCNTLAKAAEDEQNEGLDVKDTFDTSNATNIYSVNFDENAHMCSVEFTYYCDNLNYSIILYIEDVKSGQMYYCNTLTLSSDLTKDSICYTKVFALPNGEYNLRVGFTGMALDDNDILTYMPSGYLSIHNNDTAIIDAVVTFDEAFYGRAKNIILLNPLYVPIAENILSNILELEQNGKSYSSEDIYYCGIATQYNKYKEGTYNPTEWELFTDISVTTPTKCEIDPSVDIYIEYYENLTNPSFQEQLSKDQETWTPGPSKYTDIYTKDEQTTENSNNESTTLNNNENEYNTSINNDTSTESTTLKPFATIDEETSSNNNLSNKNNKNNTTFIIVFVSGGLAILIGGVIFAFSKKISKKSNKIEL